MNSVTRRSLTLFTIAAAMVLPAVASGPAPTQQQSKFEVRFMENMIDHHAMAVMMAQMCLEKAQHAELKQLCQNIITSQSAEKQTMQSWLSQWYRVSYSPQPSNAKMQKLMNLSGVEFEIEFMQDLAILATAFDRRRVYSPRAMISRRINLPLSHSSPGKP